MNFSSSILMTDLATKNGGLNHQSNSQVALQCHFGVCLLLWFLPPMALWAQEPRIVTEHANQYHGLLEDHRFSWMIFQDFPVYYFLPRLMGVVSAHSEVNKLSRDGKLRVREIGSDRVSMLKAHEEALRGQEIGFAGAGHEDFNIRQPGKMVIYPGICTIIH